MNLPPGAPFGKMKAPRTAVQRYVTRRAGRDGPEAAMRPRGRGDERPAPTTRCA